MNAERAGGAKQKVGDRRFAQPAKRKRGKGDAKLDRRQELVDVAFELEDGAGTGTAERQKLLHPGFTHADQSELRGDEEAVGQNKECDQKRSKQN